MSPAPAPARALAARPLGGPVAMFFFCLCGMATGLAIDCGNLPPAVLASLCLAVSGSPLAALATHMALLPATHLLMVVGAVLGVLLGDDGWRATRLGAHLAMLGAMLAGMLLAAWLVPAGVAALRLDPGFGGLVGAMVLGMGVGTLAAGFAGLRLSPRVTAVTGPAVDGGTGRA